MSAFERLGLTPDATEAQIKRAYARELKRVRPDEDPAGFQQLYEAYSQCLAIACGEQRFVPEPADTPHVEAFVRDDRAQAVDPVEPAPMLEQPQTVPTPEVPALSADAFAFDAEYFLEQMTQIAGNRPAAELDRWLRSHPALYSVEHKQRLTPRLIEHLFDPPSLYPAPLETVIRFFDLDGLHPLLPHLHEDVAVLRETSLQDNIELDGAGFASRHVPAHESRPQRPVSKGAAWGLFWLMMLIFLLLMSSQSSNAA
ncbi:MAG: hypothetical protein ACREP7_01875 [Lysobacter sp.]